MVLNYIPLIKFSCIDSGQTRDLRHTLSRLLLPIGIVIKCALNL